MKRIAAIAAAMVLAGCHRQAAGVTLDADSDARNTTDAKIDADLAAADAAARAPIPRTRPAARPQDEADATPDAGSAAADQDANGGE